MTYPICLRLALACCCLIPAMAEEPAPRVALDKACAYAATVYKLPTWRIVATQGTATSAGLQTVATSRRDGATRQIRLETDYGTLRKLSLIRGDELWLIEAQRSVQLAFAVSPWQDPRIDAELLTPHLYVADSSTWRVRSGTWRGQATWQIDQILPPPATPDGGDKIAILRFHLRAKDFALLAREDFTQDGRLKSYFRIDVVDQPAAPDAALFAVPSGRPQVIVHSAEEYLTMLTGATP